MFTGIIQNIGRVEAVIQKGQVWELEISAESLAKSLIVGGSVAVNGVCLTAVSVSRSSFYVQVVQKTREASTFSFLRQGDRVNLEAPLQLNQPLDGHFVLGHVDETGIIEQIQPQEGNHLFKVRVSRPSLLYLIPKGSIALDGISLTLQSLEADSFMVTIIPHTLQATNLSDRKAGDRVNLEFDYFGKYVIRYMEALASAKKENPF